MNSRGALCFEQVTKSTSPPHEILRPLLQCTYLFRGSQNTRRYIAVRERCVHQCWAVRPHLIEQFRLSGDDLHDYLCNSLGWRPTLVCMRMAVGSHRLLLHRCAELLPRGRSEGAEEWHDVRPAGALSALFTFPHEEHMHRRVIVY